MLRLADRAPAPAAAAAVLAVGGDMARSLAMRAVPSVALQIALIGGMGLCGLALFQSPRRLGLGTSGLGLRLLGGLALAAVLLLPAAVRWTGAPMLAGLPALAMAAVAAGQEIVFRGMLFASLEEMGGAAVAVCGSALAFAAVHMINHSPEFLPAILGAGLLLGLWRWAARDLVGPILAHVLADLAL